MTDPRPFEPTPVPTNPNPGALPIEIDTGGLHSRPEVDYGSIPEPIEPHPDVPNEPERPTEPDRETPAPDTEPGQNKT